MNVAGYIFAALAAVVHVYIFVLESILWTAPKTRATFGVKSEEEALTTKPLAFNQGFYNLFLAIVSVIGIVIAATGSASVGIALVLAGTGSMVAAGLVLILSSPDKARAAVVQMLFPAIAVILLAIHLL
ncbi:epimerase [Rhodococcus sp. SRB_17]|nr:epimerase [Rhodococcus sp. SRB_17]